MNNPNLWMMTLREESLCKACAACYLVFGFVAGYATVVLWETNHWYVLPASVALWFLSVYVWERIAQRVILRHRLSFEKEIKS